MSRGGNGRQAPGWENSLLVALLVLAFVAPGAWFVTHIPPTPAAKLLTLVTAGVWLFSGALGAVAFRRVDRRVLYALVGVLVVVTASYIAAGSLYEVAFFDLFADMPLVLWLTFPLLFVLAAALRVYPGGLTMGLSAVVGVGTLLSVVMAFEVLATGTSHVFGSSAYSVTALVPTIPLAVGLARGTRGVGRAGWFACAALVLVALAGFSGSTTGMVAAVFAMLLSLVVIGVSESGKADRALRVAGSVLAALAVAVMLFAQVPALSSRWVNPQSTNALGKNVVSRAYMWIGAEQMLVARPLLGFGPSGYRLHAAEYLAPEALQFGPDIAGNADPTVYSPQSPHSLFWEIATRLGMFGLVALAALLAVWGFAVIERIKSKDAATIRAALAAGFLSAMFAMLVNPVVFPIGLLAATAAGLAIAPMAKPSAAPEQSVGALARVAFAVVGVVVIAMSVWLYTGEWRMYTAQSTDVGSIIRIYESVLKTTPGQPLAERRLLEAELFSAPDTATIQAVQASVEAAPAYMLEFAPNAVDLVGFSLMQADQTGRTDVAWEQRMLDDAAAVLPPIPSLVAERLHLALVSGDKQAVGAALPLVRKWGRLYPESDAFIQRAEELLSTIPG